MRHDRPARGLRPFSLAVGAAALTVLLGAGAVYSVWVGHRAQRRLLPRGRFVDVDGARLHVVDTGRDVAATGPDAPPPLLMLHGLAGQGGHYTHSLVDRLDDRHRVVVVDRPGSGHSTWTSGAAAHGDLQAQATAMVALLDRCAIERAIVVGHSLGGALALALALEHPRQVAGLALLAPLAGLTPRLERIFGGFARTPRWLMPLLGWTLAVPVNDARRARSLVTIFAPEVVPADCRQRGGGEAHRRPGHLIGAMHDLAMLGASLRRQQPRYAGVRVPVAVLYGRRDRVLQGDDQVHALQALPDLRVTWIDDAGHMLPITRAAECAAAIRELVQRVQAEHPAPPAIPDRVPTPVPASPGPDEAAR